MDRRHFLFTTAAAGLAVQGSKAASPNQKLKVAVIGHTGRGNYGHSLDTLWLDIPETEIVAVADADEKGLASAKERLKVSQGFSSYEEMLSTVKADIVSIAPRHIDQHHAMTLAAIKAGAKGIYMEKPFCPTLEESDEIVKLCAEHQTKLALAHRNRYHPVLPVIKDLIAQDKIGRVLEIRTRGKEDKRGGGLDLWVLGSHVLNLAVYFSGAPTACSAVVLQDGRPVTKADVKNGDEGVGPLAGNEIHARFETASQIPIFFDSIQNAGTNEAGFGVQIIGTKGIIDMRIDETPFAHFLEGSPFDPVKTPRTWQIISTAGIGQPEPIANLGQHVGNHTLAVRDLIAAIKENRAPLCSDKEGHVLVEMTAAIFESHRQNGARVTFPLTERRHPLSLL